MKTKKAFTLVELSVVMAVSAIALAMLSVAIVSANNFTKNKQKLYDFQTTTANFEKTFSGALEQFQTTTYSLAPAQNSGSLTLSGTPVQTFSLAPLENQEKPTMLLKLNSITLGSYSGITEATFSTHENLISCTLTFGTDYTQTLIFHKRP